MAKLQPYKSSKRTVRGLRVIKARKPKIDVTPAEQLERTRSVVETSTRTRNRLARAELEKAYQSGKLDDLGKLQQLSQLYQEQLARETDPTEKAELEAKVASTENRAKGLQLFSQIDERQNEWSRKLNQVDNLKRKGQYAQAYELAKSVYLEQKDAYSNIADAMSGDSFLSNKYQQKVEKLTDSANNKLQDLSELEGKRQQSAGERQVKEQVKDSLKVAGGDLSVLYKAAQDGQITFPTYYAAVDEVYNQIDSMRQQYIADPKVLTIIDSAINETSATLKPDTGGGKTFNEMRLDVQRKLQNDGFHFKPILQEVDGKYKLNYEYADTSDPKYRNWGTITWQTPQGNVDVLVQQKLLKVTEAGTQVYGFEVPVFSGDLSKTSGKSQWILDSAGKYVPLNGISSSDLNMFDSTSKRLLGPVSGSIDRIQTQAYTPATSSTAEKKKPGFFYKLIRPKSWIEGKFSDNNAQSAAPSKSPLAMTFQAPRLPEQPSIPNQPSPFAAFNLPSLPKPGMQTPIAGPINPQIQVNPMPVMRFGQAQPSSLLAGLPGGFDILKQGMNAAVSGPRSYSAFYDAINKKKKYG